MLELALVFQPVDSGMEEFDQSEALYFASQSRTPAIALDCDSLSKYALKTFVDELVKDVTKITGESSARGEAMLEAHSWDFARLKQAWSKDRAGVCQLARLSYPPCPPMILDNQDLEGGLDNNNKGGKGPVDDNGISSCGGGPPPSSSSGAPAVTAPGPCAICGEVMLPPLSVARATAGRSLN